MRQGRRKRKGDNEGEESDANIAALASHGTIRGSKRQQQQQHSSNESTRATTPTPTRQAKPAATFRKNRRQKEEEPSLGAGILTVRSRQQLIDYYYNVDNVASLTSSAHKLHLAIRKKFPHITLQQCKFFLQTQSPYTLTKTPHTYIKRNPIHVSRCFELLSCDILVMRQFADTTSPERYCLIVVETFSRFIWGLVLKTRTATEIVAKFRQLLTALKPKLLLTTIFFDRESAIKGSQFRDMLKEFNVHLLLSHSPTKVSHAEAAIRTLKRSVYRYALYSRQANLIDILLRVINSYNKTKHSALHGWTPAEVLDSAQKQFILWERRYAHLRNSSENAAEPRGQLHKNTPRIGSFVRVLKKREGAHRFAKEVDPLSTSYSNAIYQVIGYNRSHAPSVRVRLVEVGSNRVQPRHYYTDELVLFFFTFIKISI